MLSCCNRLFKGGYYHVLSNKDDFYRRIEFGICPNCGEYRFLDFRIIDGVIKKRFLSGRKADLAFDKVLKNFENIKHGSKSNQNFYYGDFKITGRKDYAGNPIYLQLRRNFNNEFEVLGEVNTKIYKSG